MMVNATYLPPLTVQPLNGRHRFKLPDSLVFYWVRLWPPAGVFVGEGASKKYKRVVF